MIDYVTWNEAYSVGDSSLDAEHKQIFENIRQLYLPMQGRRPGLAAERILGNLADNSRDHFKHEEERMCEVAYAGAEDHKLLHDEMMRRIVDVQIRLMMIPPAEVLQFLKSWWLWHIQEEDHKFVPYLDEVRVWSDLNLCK